MTSLTRTSDLQEMAAYCILTWHSFCRSFYYYQLQTSASLNGNILFKNS